MNSKIARDQKERKTEKDQKEKEKLAVRNNATSTVLPFKGVHAWVEEKSRCSVTPAAQPKRFLDATRIQDLRLPCRRKVCW